MRQVKVVMVLDVEDKVDAAKFELELGDVFALDSDNRFSLNSLDSMWEIAEPNFFKKAEAKFQGTVKFQGKVIGFSLKDENSKTTIARLLLEAEQRINQIGDIRVHLEMRKQQ